MNDLMTQMAAPAAPNDGELERMSGAPRKRIRPDRGLRKLAEMHQWRRAAFIEAAVSLRSVTAEQASQNAEATAERIRAIQGGRRLGFLPANELAAVQEWKALRALWIAVSEALAADQEPDQGVHPHWKGLRALDHGAQLRCPGHASTAQSPKSDSPAGSAVADSLNTSRAWRIEPVHADRVVLAGHAARRHVPSHLARSHRIGPPMRMRVIGCGSSWIC